MLKETITAYSENNTKHINKFCGQNTEFINVKASGEPTYSDQYYVKKKLRETRSSRKFGGNVMQRSTLNIKAEFQCSFKTRLFAEPMFCFLLI
jgi:hypothetical protein